MQKRKLLLIISSGLWLVLAGWVNSTFAQVTIGITSGNLGNADVNTSNATITFSSTLSVAPTINIATASGTLSRSQGGTGMNSNLITAQVIGTGGGLLNAVDLKNMPKVSLGTSAQAIYTSVIGALAGGPVTIQYDIANLSSTAWKAGKYNGTLNFSLVGLNVGSISPASATLTVNVDAFISPSSPQAVQLNVNSLSYFRTQDITAGHNVLTTATVPLGFKLNTSATNFTYSNGYAGSADPQAPASLLSAQITSPAGNALTAVGTTAVTLSPAGGLSIPVGNQQSSTISYTIGHANLKSNFTQQGTYSTTLNYQVFDAQAIPMATSQTLTCPLTVVVSDMAELDVNQTEVNLNFASADDYKNGVYADVSNNITCSKTTPFDVYVKASDLGNGSSTLPIGIITLSPAAGSALNFNTVTLSPTAQKLASFSAPVIDQNLSIRYAIPPEQTSQLMNKAAGTYSTVVTYSLVAP